MFQGAAGFRSPSAPGREREREFAVCLDVLVELGASCSATRGLSAVNHTTLIQGSFTLPSESLLLK